MSSLDVVIVSYRCPQLLRNCLASLGRHAAQVPTQVVVVDNASADGTVELVRRDFREVELVEAGSNLGFAAAANLGIRRGQAPYVLALNPDAAVTACCLDTMLALMDAHPEIGIGGCRLVRPDGTLDHACRRSFPTILGALGHFTGVGRLEAAPRALSQYRTPWVDGGPVDAVNGAFMLMRRSALHEVGLFDEGYWMYMEDLDLCFRFKRAGWTTWYEPSATAVHVKHGTTGRRRSPRLELAFHRGMARFYREHYAPERSAATTLVVRAGIALRLGTTVLRSLVVPGAR